MAINPRRKPTIKQTTMKQLADYGNKGLKPESEFKAYEFGNGTKAKKAGKGAYQT